MKEQIEPVIKKVGFIAMAVFLVWQSYLLIPKLHELEHDSIFGLFCMGWVINMFITGIFAFSVFALPVEQLLPPVYYKVSNPKRLKSVFKTMGVEWFRKALLATIWKNPAQRAKYFNGKKEGIENLETQSKKSEFGHIFPFIILTILSVYLLFVGQTVLAFATFFFNVLGNLYPVILQRHHRMRIQILRRRQESRNSLNQKVT